MGLGDGAQCRHEIARLLLEKQADINSADPKKVTYLRNIVMSALPDDIGIAITKKMAGITSDDQVRSTWLDGYVSVALSVSGVSAEPSTSENDDNG
jgi:hypothetical protein